MAAAQWRVDGKIGQFGQQKGDRGCQYERRWGYETGQEGARNDRRHRPAPAQKLVHGVAQHEGKANHQHTRWRHKPEPDRNQMRTMRIELDADMANQPIGSGNGGSKAGQSKNTYAHSSKFSWTGRSFHLDGH